jgi:hemerythrin
VAEINFQERRRPRRFRIVHISLEAFVKRFILRQKGASLPATGEDHPVPASLSSSEKSIPWKCGVTPLDEQYELLFKAIRKFQGALKSGAQPSVIQASLNSLACQVEGHLALEEAYLEHIGFPGLAAHRPGHKAFRHQLQAFHDRLAEGDTTAGLELSQVLFAWLRVHVMKEDSVWSEFARSRRRRLNQT